MRLLTATPDKAVCANSARAYRQSKSRALTVRHASGFLATTAQALTADCAYPALDFCGHLEAGRVSCCPGCG